MLFLSEGDLGLDPAERIDGQHEVVVELGIESHIGDSETRPDANLLGHVLLSHDLAAGGEVVSQELGTGILVVTTTEDQDTRIVEVNLRVLVDLDGAVDGAVVLNTRIHRHGGGHGGRLIARLGLQSGADGTRGNEGVGRSDTGLEFDELRDQQDSAVESLVVGGLVLVGTSDQAVGDGTKLGATVVAEHVLQSDGQVGDGVSRVRGVVDVQRVVDTLRVVGVDGGGDTEGVEVVKDDLVEALDNGVVDTSVEVGDHVDTHSSHILDLDIGGVGLDLKTNNLKLLVHSDDVEFVLGTLLHLSSAHATKAVVVGGSFGDVGAGSTDITSVQRGDGFANVGGSGSTLDVDHVSLGGVTNQVDNIFH